MPRRVSHASTERIFTRSIPAASMILTWSSVISELRAQHLAGVRIDDVLEHDAAEDAVAEPLDDLAASLSASSRRPGGCRSRTR